MPATHRQPPRYRLYYTLVCPFVNIIGMYTNVPEQASIDSVQQQWLTHEFATAPKDKALILALHHPVYSFDDHHSGSPRMADAVQHAINDSRRVPNMVLTAHVHNYQRIEIPILEGSVTPFLVAGHGGYHHMHGIRVNDGTVNPTTQATLVASNHTQHGYVMLTVNAEHISGSMTLAKVVKMRFRMSMYSSTRLKRSFFPMVQWSACKAQRSEGHWNRSIRLRQTGHS